MAERVDVSRGTISNVERGRAGQMSIEELARVAGVLGAELDVRIWWHGEQLDRLLDSAHADLTDAFVRLLERRGWRTAPEVTFAIYGDRGSVDVLAFHEPTATVLVVEIKTVVPDIQAMLASLDRKSRRAIEISRHRGWEARTVGRILVIADGSTNRDRVARVDASLRAAFPDRGQRVRDWLRRPDGPVSALLFFRNATPVGVPRRRPGAERMNLTRIERDASRRRDPGEPAA